MTKENSEETTSFRIRVYSPKTQKYSYITLESISLKQARQEAATKYSQLVGDLDKGKPVARDKRRLPTYIDCFMNYMEIRRKNRYCTQHRVVCIRQLIVLLVCLAKYKPPDIKTLAVAYENDCAD